MAHVIANRRLAFHDKEGSHTVVPSEQPQPIPDRFLDHHYFRSAEESGWVRVVSKPQPDQVAKEESKVVMLDPPASTTTDLNAQTESAEPAKAKAKGKASGKAKGKAKNKVDAKPTGAIAIRTENNLGPVVSDSSPSTEEEKPEEIPPMAPDDKAEPAG